MASPSGIDWTSDLDTKQSSVIKSKSGIDWSSPSTPKSGIDWGTDTISTFSKSGIDWGSGTISPVRQQEIDDKKQNDIAVDSLHEEHFGQTDSTEAVTLEMLKRGIKGGLGIFEKGMEKISENPEKYDEEFVQMFKGIDRTLQNLDIFVATLAEDTISIIKTVETQAVTAWTTQTHLQNLLEILKTKRLLVKKN